MTTNIARPRAASPAARRGGKKREEQNERGLLSDSDRGRPTVRVVLICMQIIVLGGLVLGGIGPIVWAAKSAVSTSNDILSAPLSWWPSGIHFGNLAEAWTRVRIGKALGNTVAVAVGSTLTSLFVSITAAYVLSILQPRWGKILSGMVLATLFLPGVITLVPLYQTVLKLPLLNISLLNSFWALWLPAGANAFNVLITKRFFDGIPKSFIEAARIDGAGPIRVLWSVMLPLSRPIIGVMALLSLIGAFKDYLWPLLVIPNPDKQPISVALPRLSQSAELSINLAAVFLTIAIPVVLFLIFQRQFLRGVAMTGGVKG
ncbi:multiple sugar transport system permease protein [Kribbella aluminosa]|uniref:Multiple sugar transport system permease protein n=1 Tax=Kribbella aluminosa TaxID=416017 RepID=A0ABS4UJE6_9ACTN|nr:carbohydrate ABC transporter permease [Kribbella aluminosa]MBP2351787.1 multiple sugar transport system permease protein [Kribbella aluminosa]